MMFAVYLEGNRYATWHRERFRTGDGWRTLCGRFGRRLVQVFPGEAHFFNCASCERLHAARLAKAAAK